MKQPKIPMPKDKISGFLEVGTNDTREVVINLDHDRNDIGHIVLSPNQARMLARTLLKKAEEAEANAH